MTEKVDIELSLVERMQLGSILPREGKFITLRLVQLIREQITFSQEEIDLLELRDGENGVVTWNGAKTASGAKVLSLTPRMVGVIENALRKLDKEAKLTAATLSLYEKFIDENGEEELG